MSRRVQARTTTKNVEPGALGAPMKVTANRGIPGTSRSIQGATRTSNETRALHPKMETQQPTGRSQEHVELCRVRGSIENIKKRRSRGTQCNSARAIDDEGKRRQSALLNGR
jgi:hypothetical protein